MLEPLVLRQLLQEAIVTLAGWWCQLALPIAICSASLHFAQVSTKQPRSLLLDVDLAFEVEKFVPASP